MIPTPSESIHIAEQTVFKIYERLQHLNKPLIHCVNSNASRHYPHHFCPQFYLNNEINQNINKNPPITKHQPRYSKYGVSITNSNYRQQESIQENDATNNLTETMSFGSISFGPNANNVDETNLTLKQSRDDIIILIDDKITFQDKKDVNYSHQLNMVNFTPLKSQQNMFISLNHKQLPMQATIFDNIAFQSKTKSNCTQQFLSNCNQSHKYTKFSGSNHHNHNIIQGKQHESIVNPALNWRQYSASRRKQKSKIASINKFTQSEHNDIHKDEKQTAFNSNLKQTANQTKQQTKNDCNKQTLFQNKDLNLSKSNNNSNKNIISSKRISPFLASYDSNNQPQYSDIQNTSIIRKQQSSLTKSSLKQQKIILYDSSPYHNKGNNRSSSPYNNKDNSSPSNNKGYCGSPYKNKRSSKKLQLSFRQFEQIVEQSPFIKKYLKQTELVQLYEKIKTRIISNNSVDMVLTMLVDAAYAHVQPKKNTKVTIKSNNPQLNKDKDHNNMRTHPLKKYLNHDNKSKFIGQKNAIASRKHSEVAAKSDSKQIIKREIVGRQVKSKPIIYQNKYNCIKQLSNYLSKSRIQSNRQIS